MNAGHIFISYSRKDSVFAERLLNDLNRIGIPATYDKWILRVGDSIIEKISKSVTSADKVIVIISPNSVESRWVKKELSMALTGEINGKEASVLPVLISSAEMPAGLSDKLYADFRESYYPGLEELISSLLSNSPTNVKMYLEDSKAREDISNSFSKILEQNDISSLKRWVSSHFSAVADAIESRYMACLNFCDCENEELPGIDAVIIGPRKSIQRIILLKFGFPGEENDFQAAIDKNMETLIAVSRTTNLEPERFINVLLRCYPKMTFTTVRNKNEVFERLLTAAPKGFRCPILVSVLYFWSRRIFYSETSKMRSGGFGSLYCELASYDRLLDSLKQDT